MTSTISSQQLAVPPQNLEAERSVLGAALLDEHYLGSMVLETGLSEHDFYRPQHGLVFSAMHELHDAGEPIDPLTVTSKLAERGNSTRPVAAATSTNSPAGFPLPDTPSPTQRSSVTTPRRALCSAPPTTSRRSSASTAAGARSSSTRRNDSSSHCAPVPSENVRACLKVPSPTSWTDSNAPHATDARSPVYRPA